MKPKNVPPNVFMWHHGRCGSTVLANMLNQHPDISWKGEIFNPSAKGGKHRYLVKRPFLVKMKVKLLKRMAKPSGLGIELKGLPCQHPALIGVSLNHFSDILKSMNFEQCIFLHRKNILRKLVSVQFVDQGMRDSFHRSLNDGRNLSGTIDLNINRVRIFGKHATLLDMIEYIHAETEVAKTILQKVFKTLQLYYEDDIQEDPRNAYNNTCEFLNLEYYDAKIRDRRVNDKSLRDIISNYSELEDLLAGTNYEWMLD